jgi:hypothetical protein
MQDVILYNGSPALLVNGLSGIKTLKTKLNKKIKTSTNWKNGKVVLVLL